MRIISVDINGFRRFLRASANLDEPVLAIVGPNEAGKSSLLHALASIEHSDEYPQSDITRGGSVSTSEPVVRVLYELINEERKIVRKYKGVGNPRWYLREKLRDGRIEHAVKERVLRDMAPRSRALDRINLSLQSQRLKKALDIDVSLPTNDQQQPETIVKVLDPLAELGQQLPDAGENLTGETLKLIDTATEALSIAEEYQSNRDRRSLEITRKVLEKLRGAEQEPHPEEALISELDSIRPRFLLFSDQHRILRGEYSHSDLEDPPNALSNLFQLAELDIHELRLALTTNDPALRQTITTRANNVLREKFEAAWGQTFLSVHIQVDTDALRILIDATEEFSQIAERSDGLKAFVALFSYTAIQSPGQVKPILLIDEAERHLHYDAQADLVRVFENQDRAAKIVYTTHSAGCLPSDLGTGIRAVVPTIDNGSDTGRSTINNSFWTEGTGFSPLMLAMGASLLAIVPTRRALLAEGPSDMILLPSMFREAAGIDMLGFQIAPGVSIISPEDISDLELEAPRMAYLVDGDEGGDKLMAKLTAAGIPEELIIQLEKPFSTEDLLNTEILVGAINLELHRSHGDVHKIDKSVLGDYGRMLNLERWCRARSIKTPSKSRIATHMIERERVQPILDQERVSTVSRALDEVQLILFKGSDGGATTPKRERR